MPQTRQRLAVLFFLFTACGPQGPNYELRTLPDGSHIKLVGISKAFFPKGEKALLLTYVTDIPLDDRAQLTREVDRIWQFFRATVESAGYTTGMIMANEPRPEGIIATYGTAAFVWQQDSDGSWRKITSENDAT